MARSIVREAECFFRVSASSMRLERHFRSPRFPRQHPHRLFHRSTSRNVVKPYLLADIGEGITECQVIQWFVQPGARVEQFDKICEVQSDKASVEITARFDGIIKKLYYEADDMAKVGKPLVDIDIQSEISPEDEALTQAPGEQQSEKPSSQEQPKEPEAEMQPQVISEGEASAADERPAASPSPESLPGKHATLATPAVRHLTKELNIDIRDVPGTGKDGRITKEDVQRYASSSKEKTEPASPTTSVELRGEDKAVPLTPVQNQMFKTMTRSLSIPHFLYTDSVDFSSLNVLRKKLNTSSDHSPSLSALPFILKAVSMTLTQHPALNAHLDTTTNPSKPQLILKADHNIGIAIDTPSGLLVPIVRAVQNHSILSLASEISRLSDLARAGKLAAPDLQGATITVSNIGSIGGTVVAPVIVGPQVAILGVGRARAVPAFGPDGELVRREECVFSWSADHRVVDGAMVARCAEGVRRLLEGVEEMVVRLR